MDFPFQMVFLLPPPPGSTKPLLTPKVLPVIYFHKMNVHQLKEPQTMQNYYKYTTEMAFSFKMPYFYK